MKFSQTYTGPTIGHLTKGAPVAIIGFIHGQLLVAVRGPFIHRAESIGYWIDDASLVVTR